VDKAREANPQAAKEVLLQAAITGNVWQAIDDMLRQSPIIREKVRDSQVIGRRPFISIPPISWAAPDQETGGR
jgi:hypothetical protein